MYSTAAHEFSKNYKRYCDEFKPLLGDDYDEKMYPTQETVDKKLGINTGDASASAFNFKLVPIAQFDPALEDSLGLTFTNDEREFVERSTRSHYQEVVDRLYDEFKEVVEQVAHSDQSGRRIRPETVVNLRRKATMIIEAGEDTDTGIAAEALRIADDYPDTRRTKDNDDKYARVARAARGRKVLDALEALRA
jgi:hypothetical protein